MALQQPCSIPVQGVFLPCCQDVQHPSDTLFFYVEHDFRFHKRDDEAPKDWLPLVAGEDPLDVAASMGADPRSGASRPLGDGRRWWRSPRILAQGTLQQHAPTHSQKHS